MKDLTAIPMGRLLLVAFRWFDDSLLATLKKNGWPELSHSQSLVMAQLLINPIRISELARRIRVTRQAAQKSVSELNQLGLVETHVDPTNSSAKIVKLTDNGRQNVEAAVEAFAEIETELSKRISPVAVAQLREAMEADWGDPIVVEINQAAKKSKP